MPRCNYCHETVESMDKLTDHVAHEHNVFSAAVRGDVNALVEELRTEPAKP